MTREEAIKGLKVLRRDFSGYKPNEEMFDMATEALEHDKKEIINMKSVFNLSDDLISRQAAIEAVRSYFKDKLDGWPREETEEGYEVYCDMDKIDAFLSDNKYLTKRIDAIPSADRPKWIPVSERLPEIDKRVIVTGTMWGLWEVDIDRWNGERWVKYGGYVSAWQPIPEPYEESDGE